MNLNIFSNKNSLTNLFLLICGFNGAIAVCLGAYGAHYIDPLLVYQLRSFDTAVQYHIWHTIALGVIAAMGVRQRKSPMLALSGIAFILGIIFFCGMLYIHGITGHIPIPGLAPAGGVIMILGWTLLAVHGFYSIAVKPKPIKPDS